VKKLQSEPLDAIVLAAAGVRRLGLADRITQILDESVMLPAVGQGALCIETRDKDPRIASVVAALDDLPTRKVVMGERAFLNRLEGGCQVPIAGHGHIDKNGYTITGLVCDVDGSHQIKTGTYRSRHPERADRAGTGRSASGRRCRRNPGEAERRCTAIKKQAPCFWWAPDPATPA
jgi:porphobilinogen deaminase